MRRAAVAFANSYSAAASARRFATATARSWGLASITDLLELLVSELVTNAVRHADSPGIIELSELEAGMRVDVADECATPPTMSDIDPTADCGRGLHLVDELADAWGIDLRDDGKVVWFELSTR
jgi:anti-sigma regulatory factor (Ser/Thr protein kinase)